MSTHDSHFINIFSLVIGILVAIALILLALARSVAARTQEVDVYSDASYVASVEARVAPFAHEAVAGQDNSALAIQAPAGAGPAVALAVPKNGMELFQAVCSACHAAGLAGAPKAGDKSAWSPRIAQGKATLYQHALGGFNGKAGVMPAKGGRTDLPDDLIKQGVDYMVSLAQ
ncbi:MAG TPA: c-type cytochrome [Steroidobacteraceae bacterium]|nr:c-type cytochrome [Steroidobacteraceae bacterium]